jgi:asparagine synthase (glutamine-hydrolysing)
MCGIAGGLRLTDGAAPPSREELQRMAGALRHRGPDAFGVYRDHQVGLAHARLSIIDPRGGRQPLLDESGRWVVAFNGEIFNHVELREELAAQGRRFRTRSDTEVVVQAFAAWGDDAFARFNGQWALALWDSRDRALTLARDRFGILPLHLTEHRGRLLFASEVKALFAGQPDLPRALDPAGLDQTFTFWSIVPPQGVFRGVSELPPGHVRRYAAGQVTEHAYHRPRYDESFTGSLDDAADAVRAALESATRLRMLRADVPVGCYLSGGLDSAVVATLALAAVGQRRFATFSLRFEDAEYDETPFQRAMAARLGSAHHEVMVSRRDIAAVFPEVIRHTERPLLRTAPAPLFLLSRLVREAGTKVVLTGEGADENFAGYDLFREGKVRRFWARQPGSALRPLLLDRLYPYLARSPVGQRAMARQFFGRDLDRALQPGFAHATRWQTTAALRRLWAPGLAAELRDRDPVAALLQTLPPDFGRWSPLAQDQHLEIRTLLQGYLLSSQGDRMLMAHSVEGRFPFLDPQVVALADSLPADYKLRVLDEKHVLKRAVRALIPPVILARKKQPYRAPDALSFLGPDAPDWIGEVTSPAALRDAGVFDPVAVSRLLLKCRARAGGEPFSNTDNMAVVGVLSTQLLHRELVARPFDPGPPVTLETLVERTS